MKQITWGDPAADRKNLTIYQPDIALTTTDSTASLGVSDTQVFICSTPETRSICNDPFVSGMEYTNKLSAACAKVLKALTATGELNLVERNTTVLHVLRGGLNFGLREAVASSLKFNNHAAAFISAQRARVSEKSADWVVTESSYQKLHLSSLNQIILGDVVATGTSLEYALERIGTVASSSNAEISDLVFFTIGGPRSHEILAQTAQKFKRQFKQFRKAIVVYFEGIFPVATNDSELSIKIDGTDLLRGEGAQLAPEFIESQYENPVFPLERCTIYDAGSRAFSPAEYFGDILEYWQATHELALAGTSFDQLLKERMPQIQRSRFAAEIDLKSLCASQIAKAKVML